MNRPLTMVLVLLLLLGSTPADAAPPENASRTTKEADADADNLPLDADSREALVKFVNARLKAIVPNIATKPDEAERLTKELLKSLDAATTNTESGKKFLAEAKGVVGTVLRRIEVVRMSLEEVTKALRENPDDASSLANYGTKIQMAVDEILDEDPDKASKIVEAAREFLTDIQGRVDGEATKNAIGRQLKALAGFDRPIKSAREIIKLVGTDAAPLEAEAWVNGSALTTADLKGKVVLLDFWAVWCGPCIATFPHLKEWQEKYASKGLVIVGVTNYYGFDWDEENERPVREGGAKPAQERKMLAAFAKHYGLTHRIAIDIEKGLWEHYAVSGIPHVVLIDRQGKVAMIRVGSGERIAQSLNEMIEKLLGGEKSGEKK